MELLSAFFLLYFLDRFHLTRAALSILLAATKSKNKWAWGAPWRSEGRQARHSLTLQHAGINIFDPARIDDAMTQVELGRGGAGGGVMIKLNRTLYCIKTDVKLNKRSTRRGILLAS